MTGPMTSCSAGVPACEFRQRPAARTVGLTGRDAQCTRRRGRLRYFVNGPGPMKAGLLC